LRGGIGFYGDKKISTGLALGYSSSYWGKFYYSTTATAKNRTFYTRDFHVNKLTLTLSENFKIGTYLELSPFVDILGFGFGKNNTEKWGVDNLTGVLFMVKRDSYSYNSLMLPVIFSNMYSGLRCSFAIKNFIAGVVVGYRKARYNRYLDGGANSPYYTDYWNIYYTPIPKKSDRMFSPGVNLSYQF
jgi:hypothetical protein